MLSLIKGRPKGVLPEAWNKLQTIGVPAARLVQSTGNAPASAGTHAPDGTFVNELGKKESYCAALDFSVHNPTPLDETAVKELLVKLASIGYAGYYRKPGSDHWPASDELHIHAVYAGTKMKAELRKQISDWLSTPMLNGLASHAHYAFWNPTHDDRVPVAELVASHPA